jgi:hypothetical protein
VYVGLIVPYGLVRNTTNPIAAIVAIVMIVAYTALMTISLLSFAQGIRLGLQIEQNTRDITSAILAQNARRDGDD